MSRSPLVDQCLELLDSVGPVQARRMFGGYGLYAGGLCFAIIAFDRLFLKIDDATRADFLAAGSEPFLYEARGRTVALSYGTPPVEALESAAEMQPWAWRALGAARRAHVAKAAKAARSARATKPARPARQAAAAGTGRGRR